VVTVPSSALLLLKVTLTMLTLRLRVLLPNTFRAPPQPTMPLTTFPSEIQPSNTMFDRNRLADA